MSAIVPPSKPKLPAAEVNRLLALNNVTQAVALLGVRAYCKRTMGDPERNDFNVYDDVIFLRFPGGMLPFNANVDPIRIGWNPGVGKPFAQLKTGVAVYPRETQELL